MKLLVSSGFGLYVSSLSRTKDALTLCTVRLKDLFCSDPVKEEAHQIQLQEFEAWHWCVFNDVWYFFPILSLPAHCVDTCWTSLIWMRALKVCQSKYNFLRVLGPQIPAAFGGQTFYSRCTWMYCTIHGFSVFTHTHINSDCTCTHSIHTSICAIVK